MGYEIPTRFIITNGIISVDLVGGPLVVDEWSPASPDYIGEGIYQRWARTVIDSISIKGASNSADTMIGEIRKLQRLCEQALDYKTSRWQTSPVWMEVQGRDETGIRYALMLNGRIPEAENPFGQYFQTSWWKFGSTWQGVTLVSEHLNWSATPPLTGEDLLFNTNEIIPLIEDGGLEDWASSTSLSSWSFIGSATLQQNADLQYVDSGNYSANLVVSAGNTGELTQSAYPQVPDGAFVYVKCRVYIVSGIFTLDVSDVVVVSDEGSVISIQKAEPGWHTLEGGAQIVNPIFTGIVVNAGCLFPGNDSEYYIDSIEFGYLVGASASGDVTPTSQIPIANKFVTQGLTNIYQYVSAAWVSGNKITDNSLTIGGTAVNDAIYFGIDASGISYGPFTNIIASLSVLAEDVTYTWEYWNGAAWAAVTNPSGDAQLDVNFNSMVTWEPSSSWASGDLSAIAPAGGPGIVGLWIRARVSAVGASPVAAVSSTTEPLYTCSWNYFSTDDIEGDIKSLLRIFLERKEDASATSLTGRSVIAGARSESRGKFQSYINISDTGNMEGISISALSGSFSSDTTYPTGKRYTYSLAAPVAAGLWQMTITGASAKNYVGKHRVFLIFTIASGTPSNLDLDFYYRVNATEITVNTGALINSTLLDDFVYDFGEMNIDSPVANTFPSLVAGINLNNWAAVAFQIDIKAIVFIPIDEWSGEFSSVSAPLSLVDVDRFFIAVDSIADQGKQRNIMSYSKDDREKLLYSFIARSGNPISLFPRYNDQHIHFLVTDWYAPGPDGKQRYANSSYAHEATAEHQDRYLLNRGDDIVEKGY